MRLGPLTSFILSKERRAVPLASRSLRNTETERRLLLFRKRSLQHRANELKKRFAKLSLDIVFPNSKLLSVGQGNDELVTRFFDTDINLGSIRPSRRRFGRKLHTEAEMPACVEAETRLRMPRSLSDELVVSINL